MSLNQKTFLLFFVILIEGYVVLSSELLAIRLTIPYVGSGTDTISIIIAAVLMPLAFGYQAGGNYRPKRFLGRLINIREKLVANIVIAALFLLPALSYSFLQWFFPFLSDIGVQNRLAQTSVYAGLFLVIPVFLLGQTVPLVSNYFSKEKIAEITGGMLCFSTCGSFLGAVFSTLVLMAFLGVHHTVSLNFILLAMLAVILTKGGFSKLSAVACAVAVVAMIINSNSVMSRNHIKANNQYNTVVAGGTQAGDRVMIINGNLSSMYNDNEEKFSYINFAEKVALEPLSLDEPPRDILVLGAGGFTFGHNNTHHNFTYVDIDKDLKDVAERHVLRAPIGENKTFIPQPARAFLQGHNGQYDLIYVDMFQGGMNFPEHLATTEFMQDLRSHLKQDGVMMMNVIASPHFHDKFSRNLDDTIRSVFKFTTRVVVGDQYDLWQENKQALANVAYLYRHDDYPAQKTIYTDNKNTVFYDKP